MMHMRRGRWALLVALLAWAGLIRSGPSWAERLAEPAGYLLKVERAAYLEGRGQRQAAAVGQALLPGMTLVTGRGGALGAVLSDGTRLAVGPHTALTLLDYRFDPARRDLRLRARLAGGTLSLTAGDIARLAPGAVEIDTAEGPVRIDGPAHVLLRVP